jgi:Ulp1 family protease
MFEPSDINRLISPQELLNDVCINGCARLLQHEFSASTYPRAEHSRRCAILSTFDLPRVRYKCSDKDLWRNLQCSSYWCKSIWILPIHRASSGGHWVLCIITPHSREVFLFDSLGGHRVWRQNLKVHRVGHTSGLLPDLLLRTGYHDPHHTHGRPRQPECPPTPCNH